MTTIKAPPKECEQCGHLFYHDPRKTYEEWVTRRFCSRDCLLNYRAANARLTVSARRVAVSMFTDKQNQSPPMVLRHRIPSTEACPVWRITIIKK